MINLYGGSHGLQMDGVSWSTGFYVPLYVTLGLEGLRSLGSLNG